MWPRKQLDIDADDFLFAARQLLARRNPPAIADTVGHDWISPAEAVVSLSVRTGLDMLLAALNWPHGDEVVMSAVTIPDMPRIVRQHGLVPVAVAVDAARLEPSLADLERAISPRTRAILIAHLFGSRVEMRPIVELARRRGLLVIEDCAQAYVGPSYAGHNHSDAALFSFGPIKTATALGGAVLRIRHPRLRDRMIELQNQFPLQSRADFAARLAKYTACSAIANRRVFAAVVRTLQWLGIDFDRAFAGAAHSFDPATLFDQIRRQPCVPLVHLLRHRLATFGEGKRLVRRASRGWRLVDRVPPHSVLGAENPSHTFWVLPVRVADPPRVVASLRAAGFDATRLSSLIVIPPALGDDRADADSQQLAPWLRETVFLPNGNHMTDNEFDRMIAVLIEATRQRKPFHGSRFPGGMRIPAAT